MSSDDLTFITNEEGHKLVDRFNTLTKGTKFFDCLVGYFYSSGFHMMYKSFESTEKIRILIGISTDKKTFDLIEESKNLTLQDELNFSSKEARTHFTQKVVEEMNNSKDSKEVEEGILKFIEWLRIKKLEIRVYPTEKIHAKLYIMTSSGGGFGDKGRVITGSSNFTQSGLRNNLEFNVELKDSRDYEYALNKFNHLWENSTDVSQKYVETIHSKTWLNNDITPYELFLKFLYEYLKEKIQLDQESIENDYKPENFMDLEYQKDAVRDAKLKLDEFGGVFISDVVGLGKTFMTTMLAKELKSRILVLAPPVLLDNKNPGSWPNAFREFMIGGVYFESIGKLDSVIKRGTDKYDVVIIDEAHRFRTESTQMYEKLFKICRGKRVILVTATPLNNTPMDILSLIKLFQNTHKSTLPNPKVRDLDKYFKSLQSKLKSLDRQRDKEEYLKIVKQNAEDIRANVLQYLMVRRTRTVIDKYYGDDLKKQKLVFPKVKEPKPVIYHFSEDLDSIFNNTLNLVVKEFKYSRYTPLLYLKEELPENQQTPQKNMGRWMKILLLKRLESSFFAFKKSISRFIQSYKRFIKEYEKGYVFISERYTSKVFELLEDDDTDAVERLIEEEKARKEPASKFNSEFIRDLKSDLEILTTIEKMWVNIDIDPKLEKFVTVLKNDSILKNNKIIVFTESRETAEYLEFKLNTIFNHKVLAYSSVSGEVTRERIIENFDPSSRIKKNDIKILVTTEILSEGVNLNRSNIVINYDIPWNPIKMMQRVGRINRVGKNLPFDEIYTYNFFPAGPINEHMALTEAAEIKIQSFIEMLGNDAKLLTDEEIKSHELFKRLNSKEILTGEDETEDRELEWLLKLRDIRDNEPELFEKIKRLPKKSRTARNKNEEEGLFTFFRKGKLRKLYFNRRGFIDEIDFSHAVDLLYVTKLEKRISLNEDFYTLLEQNKKEFSDFFIKEVDTQSLGSRGHEGKIKAIVKAVLKNPIGLTDDDEEYLRGILNLIQQGSITKKTLQKLNNAVKKEDINPLKILAKIKVVIPSNSEFFKETYASFSGNVEGPKEVILSEMFVK